MLKAARSDGAAVIGLNDGTIEEVIEMIQANAVTDESGVEFLAPSRVGDERFDQQLARFQRFSVRPRAWRTTTVRR